MLPCDFCLQYQYRISEYAILLFLPQVCEVLHDVLKEEYLHFPSSETESDEIAKQFEERWDFPN